MNCFICMFVFSQGSYYLQSRSILIILPSVFSQGSYYKPFHLSSSSSFLTTIPSVSLISFHIASILYVILYSSFLSTILSVSLVQVHTATIFTNCNVCRHVCMFFDQSPCSISGEPLSLCCTWSSCDCRFISFSLLTAGKCYKGHDCLDHTEMV